MWNIHSFKPIFDFELRNVRYQDREDIMQTALLKLYVALKSRYTHPEEYCDPAKIGGLMRVITRRTVVDYFRKYHTQIEENSFPVYWNDGCEEKSDLGSAKCFYVTNYEHGYDISEIRYDYSRHRESFTSQEKRIIDYLLEHEDRVGELLSEISNKLNIHKSHASRALQKLRKICQTI